MAGEGSERGAGDAAHEEVLVRIPNAVVHLVDVEDSPHLGSGDFSVVKIAQEGSALLVMLVRVGEDLQWPLTKDEPTVKLDPTHYFFTLRVPAEVERQVAEEDDAAEASEDGKKMTLNYGVTFPGSGHEGAIEKLDEVLEKYTFFSSPKMHHGSEEQKEDMVERAQEAAELKGDERVPSATEIETATTVTSRDGNQDEEHDQSDFWTTMAPNVDEYNSSVARSIASGSGQIIRGIFWVSNATVAQLENGSMYIQQKVKPLDKPSELSPRTLANVHRARDMTRMTENVAKSILSGVLKTVGFFSGAVINSVIGKKIFQLMPGEVVMVSLDAFGKLFDALEKAGTDIMATTSLVTQNIIAHRFGAAAGQFTEDTLASAGHVLATAWTISKLRKAINPKDGALKPSYTSQAKAAAKAAIHRN